MRLSRKTMANRIGSSSQSLYNWENNRHRPRLRRLRAARDNLELPTHVLAAALKVFYTGRSFEPCEWPSTEPFWRLIATDVGSIEEQRLRNELVEQHQKIAALVANRYRGYRDFDDLRQEALIGLSAAIPAYIPSMGPLPPFAAAYCRGRILEYLRDTYYVDVSRELWRPFTAVRKAIQRIWQTTGHEPSDVDLAKELRLPLGIIADARTFLARRGFSLDATRLGESRTSHDIVGRTPGEFAHVELRADLDRILRHIPHATSVVIAHAIEDIPLRQVGQRLHLTVEQTQETLDMAHRLLRESGLRNSLDPKRNMAIESA